MAKYQLCYSKSSPDYLVWSKKSGSGYLVYKGGSSPSQLGNVLITATSTPSSWICVTYNCEHEITTALSSSFGTLKNNTIEQEPVPNFSGTFTVSAETHCSSSERPTLNIKIIAIQKGASPILKNHEMVVSSNQASFTLTLDGSGKLLSIE